MTKSNRGSQASKNVPIKLGPQTIREIEAGFYTGATEVVITRSHGHFTVIARTPTAARQASPQSGGRALSPRELQVLGFLAQGQGHKEIATTLKIHPTTVRNHIQNMLRKLGMHSKLQAVVYAYRNGLIEEPAK